MADTTLIVSVVGIGVSGVVGPAATAWATRWAARRQFVSDREVRRLDELLALLDEAAQALGLAIVRLRQSREAQGAGPDADQQVWAEQVYSIGQRLQLRLGNADPVMAAYEHARAALLDAGKRGLEAESHDAAIAAFEAARGEFLLRAQRMLRAPISDQESQR
jgi:hypothetical protein